MEKHTLASKEGKIYGSVTAEMICKRLKDHHDIDIDKKKIVIRNTLKVIGNYTIDVQLDKKIKTSFNLSIRVLESWKNDEKSRLVQIGANRYRSGQIIGADRGKPMYQYKLTSTKKVKS